MPKMELENDDFEPDVFQEKNYIPLWYHRKYFKHFCVVGSILLVLFVVIIVVVFSTNTSNSVITEKTESKNSLQSKLIILVNDSQLVSFDPESKNLSILLNTTFCAPAQNRFLEIRVDGRTYCHEGNTFPLFRQRDDYLKILFGESRFSGSSLISDDVTKNVYILDKINLLVMDASKKYLNVLFSNLYGVRNIVFDNNEGLIFMFQHSAKSFQILRANTNGSELEKIVDEFPCGIAINVNRQRLYWVNAFLEIKSSDYKGKNRQSVYSTTNRSFSTNGELAVLDDHLYWMRYTERLFSCELDNHDVCQNVKIHDIGYTDTIKFINAFSRNIPSVTHPCQIENGGCQHLCFVAGKNSHSCACQMGWQLNPDKRTCREVHDHLIYIDLYYNFTRVTDMSGSKDLIFPTPYTIESLKFKDNINFDYDILNDSFYYSDDFNVYKMNLKSNESRNRTTLVKANEAVIDDIAYDWYTGNLYVSQRGNLASDRHFLMVLKVQESKVLRKTLYSSTYDRHSAFESCPYAIALHPSKGHVFFAGVINSQAHICTLHTNGTRFHFISDPFMLFAHNCPFVSVDYSTNRLYWIFATDEITMVSHSGFDGTDLTYVVVEDVSRARMVHVHQTWIYLSNGTSIWRVNKTTGKDAVRIDGGGDHKIGGMKIVSSAVQFEGTSNPCRKNNGGCEEFCYAEPEVTCDCQSGRTVSSGGRCL